jgi:hypothetical protein
MKDDQRTVGVVEEEHPVQLLLRRPARIAAVPGRLIICQELNRHFPKDKADPPVTN